MHFIAIGSAVDCRHFGALTLGGDQAKAAQQPENTPEGEHHASGCRA